jgi:hypothetical protein
MTLATINSAARQPRGETLVTTSAAIEIDQSLDPFASANLDDRTRTTRGCVDV